MKASSIGVLGVPSSAGAHYAGQEKAPESLRTAGLLEGLRQAGFGVTDLGNLPTVRYRPRSANRKQQNLEDVVRVAALVADQITAIRGRGLFPLILGGDCTITIGAMAGLAQPSGRIGLLYFDGDPDLATPATSSSGILDSMGIAHMLGEGVPELSRLGRTYPLVSEENLVLFGFDTAELDDRTRRRLEASKMTHYTAERIRTDPKSLAREARELLERRTEGFLLHFDVDVIDSAELPLGNFPHQNEGLSIGAATTALSEFLGGSKCLGLMVTEMNPDHDPDGSLVSELTKLLIKAIQE